MFFVLIGDRPHVVDVLSFSKVKPAACWGCELSEGVQVRQRRGTSKAVLMAADS